MVKLENILKVLGTGVAAEVRDRWVSSRKRLTRNDLLDLEHVLFAIQDDLEHRSGRKPGKDIQTLNDVRNVLLDECEINEQRDGMKWPGVERMRRRIT
jgi:hypothetical protein